MIPPLPGPLRFVGKKHVELLTKWLPSLAVFGGVGATAFIYVTEWRVITDYIPVYNQKYKDSS